MKRNDEEIIQGGLVTRVGELGDQIQVQRSNLDNLRATLRFKQEEAQKLNKESALLAKSLVKLHNTRKMVLKHCAAAVIQQNFRRHYAQIKVKHYITRLHDTKSTPQVQQTMAELEQAKRDVTLNNNHVQSRLQDV